MLSAIAIRFAVLALASTAAAQTFTTCNPLNRTDCPLDPAFGMNYNFDFSQSSNSTTWNATSGSVNYGANGGAFTIKKRYDSPTIQSEWYIFFGEVEVHMRAASGQGIISSIVFESDDLDEIDWEMMGGNNTHVETNYFGKGDTSTYDRAIYYPVERPLDLYHNYTVRWTKDKIDWFIDTNLVRTLNYADAHNGTRYPQTPMTIRLGIWAGGDPSLSNGTIEWAGGITDFTKGPYTMYVQSTRITDYSTNSTTYQYGDQSGSWQSIKVVSGNSTAHNAIIGVPAESSPSIADKWAALPSNTKIGIYAGAGGAGAIILGLITFCCIRQRRRGKKERQEYEAKLQAEQSEDAAFKNAGMSMDSLPQSATPKDYESSSAGSMTKEPLPDVPPLPKTYANSPTYGDGGLKSPNAFPNTAYADGGLRSPTENHHDAYGNGGLPSPSAYSANQEYSANSFNGSRRYSNNGSNEFQGNGFSRQASASSAAGFQPGGFSRQASATSAAGFQPGNFSRQASYSSAAGFQPNNFSRHPSASSAANFQPNFSRQVAASPVSDFQPNGFSRQTSAASNAGFQPNGFSRQASASSIGGFQPNFSRQASPAPYGGSQPNFSRVASPAPYGGSQPNFSRQVSTPSNNGGISYSSRPGGSGPPGRF